MQVITRTKTIYYYDKRTLYSLSLLYHTSSSSSTCTGNPTPESKFKSSLDLDSIRRLDIMSLGTANDGQL